MENRRDVARPPRLENELPCLFGRAEDIAMSILAGLVGGGVEMQQSWLLITKECPADGNVLGRGDGSE